jgi:hypothetical protein
MFMVGSMSEKTEVVRTSRTIGRGAFGFAQADATTSVSTHARQNAERTQPQDFIKPRPKRKWR